MEGDTFGKYLPNFEYYLVPLRKYSNEELLAKKDEISLVMMINRMQNAEDIEEFRNLPTEEMEFILKETPEHLLDIISDILRAFLMKMNVPVAETEELVGKVKEKKMGYLFENMEKMDIQAERRQTAEQRQRAEQAEQQIEKSIQIFVETCQELGETQEQISQRMQEKYGMSEAEVWEKVKLYWCQ